MASITVTDIFSLCSTRKTKINSISGNNITTSRLEKKSNTSSCYAVASIDIDINKLNQKIGSNSTLNKITINYTTESSVNAGGFNKPTVKTGFIDGNGNEQWAGSDSANYHTCGAQNNPLSFSDSLNAAGAKSYDGSYHLLLGAWNVISVYVAWVKFTNISLTLEYTPHTHSYTSAITKHPNCTETGVRTYTCSCGSSYTETIPANGHTPDREAPNCMWAQWCTVCGSMIAPALGHSFGATTAAKAATCLATGNTAYKQCLRCGLYYKGDATTDALGGRTDTSDFVTAKLNHSYISQVIKPTAAADGYTLHTCQNGCGGSYKDNYTINKIFYGTTQPEKIFFGTQEVKEVYYGTTKVYGPK